MKQLGTLETIYRYPVKSMAGEELERAFVGYSGMMGDRVYAFVRADGPKGFPWHTGREQEDLVLFRPRFRQVEAASVPADIEASFGFAPGVNPLFPPDSAFEVDVTTPDGRVVPLQSAELATEMERRNGNVVSLRFSERSLYDCRPISIFGNATVRGLGDELGMPIDRRRFRANFYVDWADDRPYRENDLLGQTLEVGERLRIAIVERDPRCKMITIDPETAKTEPQILRHVNAAHGGTAGVYAAVLLEGVVRKGDAICLVE
jgi:uncharacterized protein YcbX